MLKTEDGDVTEKAGSYDGKSSQYGITYTGDLKQETAAWDGGDQIAYVADGDATQESKSAFGDVRQELTAADGEGNKLHQKSKGGDDIQIMEKP